MAYKINDLTALGRNLASTDQLEVSLTGATGSRKITGAQIIGAAVASQVGYKGFKYNMGIGEDYPNPPVPLAGQAFILVDIDGYFQGFRISTIDADGKSNSTYLNKINSQPITIANADGSISTYVADSVTFVGGANPYYNIPPGTFEGPILSGIAYIDYNTSFPALVSGTTIKTINGSSILGSGNLNTFSLVPIQTVTSSGTVTPTTSNQLVVITAQAATLVLAAPTGTPAQGQPLMIRIKDNGIPRAISWAAGTAGYRAIGVALPTTTVANKTTYVGCIYNSTDSRWDVIGVTTEA